MTNAGKEWLALKLRCTYDTSNPIDILMHALLITLVPKATQEMLHAAVNTSIFSTCMIVRE